MLIFGIIAGLVVGELTVCAVLATIEFKHEKKYKENISDLSEDNDERPIRSEEDELWGF